MLERLLAERPELSVDAERVAAELLSTASVDQVRASVEAALIGIPLDALAARAGRFRGGYVDETEAAWALVEEAVEPFRSDVERRAALGFSNAATDMVVGIVGGLYRVREPEMGTVLGYAGEDSPYDNAVAVLALAATLGLEPPSEMAADLWPDWPDLW